MQRTLAEIERCRDSLGLPTGAEHSLSVFQRAEQLHPSISELQQVTEEQSATFTVCTILLITACDSQKCKPFSL